jgi:cellulose biosynthesis protein BcsQ
VPKNQREKGSRSLIITVTSPVHGQTGNTTAALLISLLLAKEHNKSVCLTHLSPQSSAFCSYLGLDGLEDKTCSPSQVAKLLREGAIEPRDMVDYCLRVCDNLDIFSNNSKSFSDEDMELTQRFILENMPHDFIVLDVDINTTEPLAKYALNKSDLAVVCMTQSLNVAERYAEVFTEKPANNTLFLCNQYSPDIGSVAAFAKSMNAKIKDCCILPHSALLMKLSNTGKLGDIIPLAKSLPLPDIEGGMSKLALTIMQQFKARGRATSASRTATPGVRR